ncbi:hypothetical protein [Rubritalea tangerina]|uniref:hypothetical protein n=1 Tax=Rubritalea tangerina TaxID=430798 RepID=UPI003608B993
MESMVSETDHVRRCGQIASHCEQAENEMKNYGLPSHHTNVVIDRDRRMSLLWGRRRGRQFCSHSF